MAPIGKTQLPPGTRENATDRLELLGMSDPAILDLGQRVRLLLEPSTQL